MRSRSKIGLLLLASVCFTVGCGFQPNPQFNERTRSNGGVAVVNSASLQRLQAEIESLLGVPYRWGGVSRQGMDCSGFVYTVFRNALDINLPRKARHMFKKGVRVDRKDLRYGDLVFFEKIENYGISHVGIYLGDDEFAHASTSQGVVISNLNEEYYHTRYVGARRILEP